MKKVISKKMIWVSTDPWRGYEQPVNAICGANDTGNYGDSPCKSKMATHELNLVKARLTQAGIEHEEWSGVSSNVFCIHRYILVHPEDQERAREIARELEARTHLLYVVEKYEPSKKAS